jgi:hypothetical protein
MPALIEAGLRKEADRLEMNEGSLTTMLALIGWMRYLMESHALRLA